MSLSYSRTLFLAVACLAAAIPADAQPASGGQPPGAPAVSRRATVTKVNSDPVVDGHLDEAVWSQAAPISDFRMIEPREGLPATEPTEVRMIYTSSTLYVGVELFDADPSKILTTDSRRDSALSGQDSFQMIFDTYNDRQNGFVFGTNASGIQYDAQVRNEGETLRGGPPTGLGGGNAGGAGAGINTNWDGSWVVKTSVTERGWTAEFAIPLKTLRYGPPPQTWGVNFSRNVEHKREVNYWSPMPRIFGITRLSQAGVLTGLDVPAPRDFKIIPYVVGSTNRNFASRNETAYVKDGNWGADAKIGVTSSTTLDLTYNTDFAQVEVDEQQINLTRFNLLFPEKRPFFLENRGIFAVGRPGEIDLFFSRRIGINDSGTLLPIQAGARLTGKVNGVNVGFLNMQTKSVGLPETSGFTTGNNYTAGRLSKDFRNRSGFGAIFVNRIGTGDYAGDDNYNRTFGIDGKWGIKQTVTLAGFFAKTQTPGLTGPNHALSGAFDFRTRQYEATVSYAEVGDDFNPEVGFLGRPDGYRQTNITLRRRIRTPRLAKLGIREMEPHASYESFWGFDGFQETATLHVDNRFDFEKGFSLTSTALNVQYEGLRKPFEVYPGVVVPVGSYRSPYFLTQMSSDRRKWISVGMSANLGGFLSGSQVSLGPSLNIRRGGRLTSTLRWTRNDIDLPQGQFVTNLGSARVTYNFSTLVNASGLLQYNDRTKRWSTNLRFNWLLTAASGLYVVYNDTEAFNGLGPVSRAFIIKYGHQFDVFN